MSNSCNNINTISLGSSAFNAPVYSSFVNTGAVVTIIDQNQWLGTPVLKVSGVAVLALESHDYANKQIISAILRHPTTTYFSAYCSANYQASQRNCQWSFSLL